MKTAAIVLGIVLVAGCHHAAQVIEIKPGMVRDQVEALIGPSLRDPIIINAPGKPEVVMVQYLGWSVDYEADVVKQATAQP